jgi:hypothetical protein
MVDTSLAIFSIAKGIIEKGSPLGCRAFAASKKEIAGGLIRIQKQTLLHRLFIK